MWDLQYLRRFRSSGQNLHQLLISRRSNNGGRGGEEIGNRSQSPKSGLGTSLMTGCKITWLDLALPRDAGSY
jgi:hypothetical protein